MEIITPENIAFRYEVAGPFRRMPAFLIDFALRLGAMFVLGFALSFTSFITGFLAPGVLLLCWFVMEWFYGGLFETFWNGQTPGKRVMGIRVLGVAGRPINGLQAVMRNILRAADLNPLLPLSALVNEELPLMIPTCLVGLLVPMFNRKFQRLGDLCCGTIVVAEERSWLFGVSKIDDPRAARLAEYIPANFEIRKQLSRAIATYVERRKFFPPARRREIARHLAQPLLEKWNLPADTSYDLFICALYHRAFIADRGNADEEDILQTIGESPFAMPNPMPEQKPEFVPSSTASPLKLDVFRKDVSSATTTVSETPPASDNNPSADTESSL